MSTRRSGLRAGTAPLVFIVLVEADSVPDKPSSGVLVEACQDGGCRSAQIDLTPGMDSVDLGCAGDAHDAPCSAVSVPNGTLTGFWAVDGFAAGPLTATVAGRGFGPFAAEVVGTNAVSGAGSCQQTRFQTTLRISGGVLTAPESRVVPD